MKLKIIRAVLVKNACRLNGISTHDSVRGWFFQQEITPTRF